MTHDRIWLEAEARWQRIVQERPDLEPAVSLQRTLIARVLETVEVMAIGDRPEVEFPPRYLALKIARGVPLLHGEQLPVPRDPLAPFLARFASDLAAGGAGPAAEHVAAAISSGRIDAGSLLTASLARDQDAIRVSSTHLGLAPDLLWLVGELTTSAFVHQLARSAWSSLAGRSSVVDEPGLGDLVEEHLEHAAWNRGYCPTCGSWAVLIALEGRARSLRCSYCATPWRMREHHCAYCGQSDERFRILAPDADHPDRLLEACDACGGYLKAIALELAAPFPLLAIEDLATVDLDRAAMELGYQRPPLPPTYPA